LHTAIALYGRVDSELHRLGSEGEESERRWALAFVMYVFPWGKPGFLEHHDGPDLWQLDFLRPGRTPVGIKFKSSRIRVLRRDSKPLVEHLQAYAIQYRERLEKQYDIEPDETSRPSASSTRSVDIANG
jgi:hypothetical protein